MTATLSSVTQWECPNCHQTDVTRETRPHVRFHVCPALRGLTAPMVKVGTRAKVEVREREDYVNGEKVQRDANGRPIMSIVTTRNDGQDVVVFAPTATAKAKEF